MSQPLKELTLPDLPYDYADLQPTINADIMELHHSKHHAAYVANFNATLAKYREAEAEGDVSKMISLEPALRFNGGGHLNHDIFWTNLAPKDQGGGEAPEGELAAAIEKEWGGIKEFIEHFNAKTAAIQGSGWGWLGYNPQHKRLEYASCSNQDPLQATTGLIPLLGIDVWEHGYYLQYKNLRPAYLKAIWDVVNWKNVAERFAKATKSA
jgi:Fe-Mn family superoxide dismutase